MESGWFYKTAATALMFTRILRYGLWSAHKDKLIQEELHFVNSSLCYSSVEWRVKTVFESDFLRVC